MSDELPSAIVYPDQENGPVPDAVRVCEWAVPEVAAVSAAGIATSGTVTCVLVGAQATCTFVTLLEPTVPEPLVTVHVWPEGWALTVTE